MLAIAIAFLIAVSPERPTQLRAQSPDPEPATVLLPWTGRGVDLDRVPPPPTGLATATSGAGPGTPTPGATPTVTATLRATPPATVTSTLPSTTTPTATPAPACDALPFFDDDRAPSHVIHVATGGDDGAGDGSVGAPYATLGRAARDAAPGSAIRMGGGRYAGGVYIDDLRGRSDAPIWIGAADPDDPPVLEGSGEGMHLTRAAYVVVHDLIVRGASGNGINADDGGAVDDADASHHLAFREVVIEDIGGGGNQDCLKLSGLRDVLVDGLRASRCGGSGSGSGVDMVGVHRAIVARGRFTALSGGALQAKGGSTDVDFRWNRVDDGGARGVNMGGSTGPQFFRPPLVRDGVTANAEAGDVRVVANLFVGGMTPVAFVGCADCLVAHNTIVAPETWVLRILQESRTEGDVVFEPARGGVFANNLVVVDRAQLRTWANVGTGTAPETFRFAHNLWFARDEPTRSAPTLPVMETGGIVGLDPLLGDEGAIAQGSPAIGAAEPGVAADVRADLVGRCRPAAPSIGAREP